MTSYRELDWQHKLGISVAAVGLAAVAGITGLLVAGNGKFSGVTEAVETANAVCDATQAVMRQEINDLNVEVGGWNASSDNWGRTAEAAIAQLTQIASGTQITPVPVEMTQLVEATREVTVVVTPTGLICYAPVTATRTPTPTDTATATRTATLMASATLPRPTNVYTEVSTQRPTDFVPTGTQASTELPVPTNTLRPADTNTPQPLDTYTPVPQNTPTERSTTPPQTPIPTP